MRAEGGVTGSTSAAPRRTTYLLATERGQCVALKERLTGLLADAAL